MPITRRLLLVAAPATALFTACAPAPVASGTGDPAFDAWYRNIDEQLKADPYAKPIAIRGKVAGDEYLARLRDAFHHRITREELVQWFDARYPGQRYEISFIAQRLPR